MNTPSAPELAAFVLRLGLGTMYLAHSVVLKLLTFGLAGTAGFFVSVGLPGWLGYATFAGEAVGGALLILGIGSRWVALGLIAPLLGAIIWVHGGNGWLFEAKGGGWEYPAFLIVASVAQFLLGNGAFALSRSVIGPRGSMPTAA
jgi:putative oxidoreductase